MHMQRKKILSPLIPFVCIVCLSILTLTYPYALLSALDALDHNAASIGEPLYTVSDKITFHADYTPRWDGVSESRTEYNGIRNVGTMYISKNGSDRSYYLSSLGMGPVEGGSGDVADEHFDTDIDSNGIITIKLPGATGISAGDPSSAVSIIIQKYKEIGVVIIGVCVITAIICLLFQITKLGAAGDNEYKRASALKGIIFSGAVIAMFGALSLVLGIFWNALL